jgi:LacI family transcriptional regulator
MMAARAKEEERNAQQNETASIVPPSSSLPLLGVFISVETSREYERGLLRGICRYNSLHQRWRVDLSLDGQFPRDADGVIMEDRRGSPALLNRGVPIIFIGSLHKEIRRGHRIVSDDQAIGQMAAAHLLERGLRRFGFVGYDGRYWSRLRQESFSRALADAHCTCTTFAQAPELRLRDWRREQRVLAEWLRTLAVPVGLLACNDDRARQVVDACATAGLSVPEQVAVLGVDNDEFVCNLSNPPISSVSLNLEDVGYRAAVLLDELMAARNGRGTCCPSQIQVSPVSVAARQSTEVASVADPCVMQALQFIRENSHRPIRIDEVARRVAISRRSLCDRFRQAVGCTVHQHIRKTRTARIEELLLGSSHSIGEIAKKLGFADSDHIAQYFRSVKGTTPGAFRARQVRDP